MQSLNQALFHFIFQLSGKNFLLDDIGVFFAEYFAYVLVIAFLVLVYYQEGWRRKVYLFAEGALAVILARGIIEPFIHLFYQVPRPFGFYNFTPLIPESGWSFPSGHASLFFALAMVVWFVNRKWGWWFFGSATVMGIARVYVGVHWPFDIVGGAIVGMLSGLFIHWLLRESREALNKKP